jgi:3-oxoacyl-[acyl-carrier-protein] synthase-1
VNPLAVTAFTSTTAAGHGNDALAAALVTARSGLRPNDFTKHPLETWIGRVDGVERHDWPARFATWECRNNRLAWLGLQGDGFRDAVAAARRRHGSGRVALVLGTSTASIGATEEAYARLGPDGLFPPDLRRPEIHEPNSLSGFVAAALELTGPVVTVSTACSSSAKVFAQAARMIHLGLVDAAVVGGVDTLCGSVLFGFNSLELVSARPCQPFDVARSGISLGEAAGFALIERDADAAAFLRGYGESSDAHHMSTPHPDGLGARLAIEGALARANCTPADVQYVNLHGTASQKNDEVEAKVVAEVFPADTVAGSTKGWTGHTLGAAGVVEAIVCLLAIGRRYRPGTLNTTQLDPACGPQIRIDGGAGRVDVALTESFGFGGNNAVLVFGREAHA